jgi:hypothetical protein
MSESELISKCKSIQYGLVIAGMILLVVFLFNYYNDYNTKCLTQCQNSYQNCANGCRLTKPHIPQAAPQQVGPNFSSYFADAPHKKKDVGLFSKKMTENQLHEGFLNYSASADPVDFNSYYDAPNADSYNPAKDSLEQSVYDSHQQFTDDAYVSTQGASGAQSERDDAMDINPRVGLRQVDYQSVSSGDDARTVSSEYPDQLPIHTGSIVL